MSRPDLSQRRPVVRWLRRLLLPAMLIGFLVQGFRLLPGYRGQMNPDGVGYLTVARQLLHGHFWDSANAYWSPLYSWLLVPLMAMGVESTLATKVLALFIGAAILAIVWWLLANLFVPRDARVIVTLTLMPILYYCGMDVTTPDLLIVAALLLYVAHLTMPDYGRRWIDGPITGLLAGLAYLAKAYALPIVAVHLAIVALIHWRSHRRHFWRNNVATAAVFLLIVGGWAGVLTAKYGHFTVGSTGKFNIAWNGPKFVVPMHAGRLIAPPTESGTSGWDDATLLSPTPWKPLATWEDRQLFEKNRARNENEIIKLLQRYSWLVWPIVLLSVRLAGSRLDPRPRKPGAAVLLLLLIYPLGYYLLHVYDRFLWIQAVGLLVLGVFVATRLTWPIRRAWLRASLRVALVLLVAWSMLSKPGHKPDPDRPMMALGRWSIAQRWGKEDHHRRRAADLAGLMRPRAKVASNTNWHESLSLSYLLDLRYYGEFANKASEAEIRDDLAQHGVEYFWLWNRKPYGFLSGAKEIPQHKVLGLRIYDLRPVLTAPAAPTTLTTQP